MFVFCSNYGGLNTKKSVSLTDSEVPTFLEGEENQYAKRKTESFGASIIFLSAEDENRQLENLPLADFGRLPEKLLLSLKIKSINENFVNWKLQPLFLLSWFNVFLDLKS